MDNPLDKTYIESEAARVAGSALGGADMTLSWRDAGYAGPVAAAAALVGDGVSPEIRRRAVELVAEALARG